MDRKSIIVLFLAVLIIWGCGAYGRLGPSVQPGTGPSIEELLERSDEFEVSVVNSSLGRPVALLFSPAGEDRILMGDKGGRLVGIADASTTRRIIDLRGGNPSRLVTVLGPDGASYGYAYTSQRHLILRLIDENTMRAYALTRTDRQGGGP